MRVNLNDVRMALREQYLTAGDVDQFPLQKENLGFTTPDPSLPAVGEDHQSRIWLRERFQPNVEDQIAYDLIQAIGRIQYDVVCPSGMGTDEIEAIANDIVTVFKPGTPIEGFGVKFLIDESSRGSGFEFGDNW